ncbi:SWIM zinc finger family protein [Streptomyces pinistramenti]|uniref:SWIM zinc finger family protein n=1 Tax=Streptomyces pinistramenti TaxID=2884812 RepID=UPI001D05DC54|nr:SWIM zinc finger family protein [Streptomyces pinistramenti]MCB5907206.1 SWIM zinc finger family protein [Streptomyces pinistramenti]
MSPHSADGPGRRTTGAPGPAPGASFRNRHTASGRAAAADRLARADRSRTFPPLPSRSGDEAFAASWWGSAWLDALETTALDGARLARGRTYAADGHVDTINVTPGRILATVRGSRPRPYSAEIRLRTLTDEDWSALLDAIAAEPDHLTALLAKKLPEALADGAVRLLPGPGDLVPRCSCPDHGRPCKHAAALCFQAARLLDADPFVLLLMRGRGERELLDDLTRRSAVHTVRETRETPRTAPSDRARKTARGLPPGSATGAAPVANGRPSSENPASYAPLPAQPEAAPHGAAAGRELSPASAVRGILARDALAERPRPPLPPPFPPPAQPGAAPALPDGDDLPFDPAALEFLAADAAARAHACLTAAARPPGPARTPVPGPFPALTPWEDAIRLAATAHPTAGLTSTTRALFRDLAAATDRAPADVARAVAAWRQGGLEGLSLLEEPWNPPAGDFDRARSTLLAADLPAMRPQDNRLTDPQRHVQLRYGHDGRWYPYESEPGAEDWWPTGPADPDPLGALTDLLAR